MRYYAPARTAKFKKTDQNKYVEQLKLSNIEWESKMVRPF